MNEINAIICAQKERFKMIVDLTVVASLRDVEPANENKKKAWSKHLGIHFDVMTGFQS